MSANRKLTAILTLSWITYTTAYLCRVNFSTVLDKLSQQNISLELIGAASSVYFVTYATGQLLNGIAGDRVNPHRFVMFALLMTGLINVTLGLCANGILLVLLWGINGFCQSMFWSTLLRLLSFYAEEHQRKNISTIMSTTSVTGYLLSWVVLAKIFEPFGHLPYFAVPGIIALLLIPSWFVISKAMPFTEKTADRAPTPPLAVAFGEFMHDRLWLVCLLCLLIGAIQEGAVFWLPMIFTTVFELGESSLLLLAFIPFAKLAGLFLARAVLAKTSDDPRRSILMTLSLSLAISLLLTATSSSTSFFTVLLIAALIAAINASNWFMISYLPLYFSSRNIVATLVGAFDFCTYIGAALVSGKLGGLLIIHGWRILPVIWLVLVTLSLLLAFGGAGSCLARKGMRR